MGICLDTEQNNEGEESEGGTTRARSGWEGAGAGRAAATPPAGGFPMQNTSRVKFESPTVPVIFVLGGPGSGKVTHCDNLAQERRGLVHINMTDLLQQYTIGNDMQDFSSLSSRTVTEVLMLEMKMAPGAKAYLVSGYPRSMRDVAEYSEKIQSMNGAVLVSWRQRVLERQIDYGAKLGHVVLSLARMELRNFYKNVMPVADYFDQTNMLIAVNGERNPEEVYKDFRAAVLQILGNAENEAAAAHGITVVGPTGIPGEIVGVEPASPPPAQTTRPPAPVPAALVAAFANSATAPQPELIRVREAESRRDAWPALLCVIGGPGSNKAALCRRAVAHIAGWTHFSLGQRLRGLADTAGGAGSEAAAARAALGGGELCAPALASRLVREAASTQARAHALGLVLDGYPRDMQQLQQLEKEYAQSPRVVLLDCSKLQLGRGRRDDSVAAFRRRLELFRELSLPMLKALDAQHRLTIVDGDTDSADVQAEFTRVLLDEMQRATPTVTAAAASPPRAPRSASDRQTTVSQLTAAAARLAGAGAGAGAGLNGTQEIPNGVVRNGGLPNGLANGFAGITTNRVQPIADGPKIPTVSQLNQESIRRIYENSTDDNYRVNTHI